MKKQLADEYQLQAITAGAESVLVLAGPGSGKTFIITHRIQFLINNLQISPKRILVITFTKKAAYEMKERYLKLDPGHGPEVNFGTFHAVFYQFLKLFSKTNLKIISNTEKIKLLNDIINSNYQFYFENNDSPIDVDDVASKVSEFKSGAADSFSSNIKIQALVNEYEAMKRQLHCIDFDDILLDTYKLINENIAAKEKLKSLFDFILIDEFQDINRVQWDIITSILKDSSYIFAVGDDDQSIYAFRGSDNSIMKEFINKYNCRVIELKYNYRSCKDILDKANIVINHNKSRIKTGIYKSVQGNNGAVNINKFDSFEAQLKNITDYIERNSDKSIAVLLRTNKDVWQYKKKLFIASSYPGEKADEYNIIYAYVHFCIYKDRQSLLTVLRNPESYISNSIIISETVDLKKLSNINAVRPSGHRLSVLYNHFKILEHLSPFAFISYLYNIIGIHKSANSPKIYELARTSTDLLYFLKTMENKINELSDLSDSKISDDKLSVITYHASKGLEFDTVFLPDINEGRVPNNSNVFETDFEEERRLFYVAMTRAKEELYISYIKKEGSKRMLPSRFIVDLLE